MELSYELIRPLIVMTNHVRGSSRLVVRFQIPGSYEQVEASCRVNLPKGEKAEAGATKAAAKSHVRGSVRGLVRRFLRGSKGKSDRQKAVKSAPPAAEDAEAGLSEAFKGAVVGAFRRVESRFQWHEGVQTWVEGAQRQWTPLEVALYQHPIHAPHDRWLLARILAELANADGQIASEELAFFASVAPPEHGTLDQLVAQGAVPREECKKVTPGVNESIYLCAWTIVLSDLGLHPKEGAMLGRFSNWLTIHDGRRVELTRLVREHTLSSAIYADIPDKELFEIAGDLGVDRRTAERVRSEQR